MKNENLTLMSFNILCDKPSDERIERLIAMTKKYSADSIGMQEVTPYWLSFLKPALSDYECVAAVSGIVHPLFAYFVRQGRAQLHFLQQKQAEAR